LHGIVAAMGTWSSQRAKNCVLRIPRDQEVTEIAGRQHGLITRRQLYELGFAPNTIRNRTASGRLHEVRPSVFAIGSRHVVGRARLLAAVFACGDGAFASHRNAGGVWEIVSTPSDPIHITTTGRGLRQRPGVKLHRVRALHPDDTTEIDGIPVTSLPRTLLDLAEVITINRLERAIENAERLRIFDLNALTQLLGRSPGRHGRKPLSMLLSKLIEPDRTRSDLERDFVALCERAGIPPPRLNILIAGFEVDAVWLDARLIVELDSYAFHGTRAAFERDRARDAQLQIAGYRVLRITHRMIHHEPEKTIRLLRALLSS
jgi:Protein of unknown function (DUF559)/Transcriptional regulator, AbiEi antitoxin